MNINMYENISKVKVLTDGSISSTHKLALERCGLSSRFYARMTACRCRPHDPKTGIADSMVDTENPAADAWQHMEKATRTPVWHGIVQL
jgi:hypothetical protein